MAKFNPAQLADLLEEARLERKALALLDHPFFGLADEKGSLTRYPIPKKGERPLLPREWVEEFVALGGGFDFNGVYGLNPNGHWSMAPSVSPERVVALASLNPDKGDFPRHDKILWDAYLLWESLSQAMPTKGDLIAMERAKNRQRIIVQYGCAPKHPIALGYMGQAKFVAHVRRTMFWRDERKSKNKLS